MTWELFSDQKEDDEVTFQTVVYTDDDGVEVDKDKATRAIVREYVEGELVNIIHGRVS